MEGKINVHLVPHSHDDTGWLITVDQYFQKEVYYVVDTVVDQLLRDENRKFMFVEIAFFARWWDEQPDHRRNQTRMLVQEGRLEFVNGGWCMHDEASTHYVEMVDQTTRGHQFLLKQFGESAIPTCTWQIDPFGHSNTQAWLLGAESGMQSMFWGRMDYQDREVRKPKKKLEWIWEGSESLGSSSRTFSGNLYGTGNGGYSTWMNFDSNGDQVNDNPKRHDYNIDQWVDKFIQDAQKQANDTATDHQLWACGTDFQYQNADHWYHNLDKLIHYVNQNGTVNAFYSTPSIYTDEKFKAGLEWEVRKQDDIFPLANNDHQYWTGYFTSRPALKQQVRKASNFMNAARQMEVLSGVTAEEVDSPTTRPSPEVGDSWTDSLEGTIAVATHHDAISGSPKQAVADDYEQRMSESSFEVETGVALSLQKLLGVDTNLGHCNCNMEGNCLNMSICAYTTNHEKFGVVAWNPLGQATTEYARLPVKGIGWAVTGPDGSKVSSQVAPIDDRTYELPKLYVNKAHMKKDDIQKAEEALSNQATHILTFPMYLGAMGYGVYGVAQSNDAKVAEQSTATTVSNGIYTLEFDPETNELLTLSNKAGATTPLNLEWGWYKSSTGGCTIETSSTGEVVNYGCDSQKSGAYMFRPNSSEVYYPGPTVKPTLEVLEGDVVTEVYQRYSDWVSHVIRLYKDEPFVEVEYTVGPIPVENAWIPVPTPPPTPPTPAGCVNGTVHVPTSGTSIWTQHVDLPSSAAGTKVETTILAGFFGNAWTDGGPCCGDQFINSAENVDSDGFDVQVERTNADGWGQELYVGWKAGGDHCPFPASPAPVDTNFGKEVILRYNTDLQSKGTFHTDSNGREMVKRQFNARPSSYPELKVTEPVAGNYYPINAMASIDDGKTEFAVLTEVTQGGASLSDGSLELMVHRRVLEDDARGVAEPLSETMCGCRLDKNCDCAGLTMRGRHWIVLDSIENVNAVRRTLSERQNFGATLAFGPSGLATKQPTFSALANELPQNVKLQTLTNNYASLHGGRLLFRLSHLYSVGEHPTLSQPVQIDLSTLFGEANKIISAEEMSASAALNREQVEKSKYDWKTDGEDCPSGQWVPTMGLKVLLRPMEVKTFLIEFEKKEVVV